MSELSAKAKRQILLLGSDLIMRIKSSSYKENAEILSDLENRLVYLKSRSIVSPSYTLNDLIHDTCICTSVSETYKKPLLKTSKKKKRSRSKSRK
jgi:hypothetical protein